ncbi:uncharacterized protein LOC132610772 [Lycium barbarum]|uniref:uncharacterized protein LOC132610772 n=1 Tax=Lycium barbarum TaxID=112863 RepID=UPI00293F0281|nr:uncharacterized protein LOC132610772 [Lycium barbarum]
MANVQSYASDVVSNKGNGHVDQSDEPRITLTKEQYGHMMSLLQQFQGANLTENGNNSNNPNAGNGNLNFAGAPSTKRPQEVGRPKMGYISYAPSAWRAAVVLTPTSQVEVVHILVCLLLFLVMVLVLIVTLHKVTHTPLQITFFMGITAVLILL